VIAFPIPLEIFQAPLFDRDAAWTCSGHLALRLQRWADVMYDLHGVNHLPMAVEGLSFDPDLGTLGPDLPR
jgi:hypothetical protein